MRKPKVDEEELFKELNTMCIGCTKDCKQPKRVKICKCPFYSPK